MADAEPFVRKHGAFDIGPSRQPFATQLAESGYCNLVIPGGCPMPIEYLLVNAINGILLGFDELSARIKKLENNNG